MFGISFFELIAIFVVVLIVFGPDKLPEIARTLGKLSGELTKQTNALRREFYNSVYTPADDFRTRIGTEVRELRSVSNTALEPAAPSAAEPVSQALEKPPASETPHAEPEDKK